MKDSVTHHHLNAVIVSELRPAQAVVRILDMGCGRGRLMAFLQRHLPTMCSSVEFEIHGFDVGDSFVQSADYFDDAADNLRCEFPDIDWSKRLSQITTRDSWPYADELFDFVVSNQVMEHVQDPDFVFAEVRRVLKTGGVSAHLFPLKYYLFETHLNIPFVHWISNRDLLVSHIKWWNRLGIGKYQQQRQRSSGALTLDEYAEKHADYLLFETNYLSLGEVYRCAKRQRLHCSFRYTPEFYHNKLRAMIGAPCRQRYATKRHPWWERVSFCLYSLLSCVTLVLEKPKSYTR